MTRTAIFAALSALAIAGCEGNNPITGGGSGGGGGSGTPSETTCSTSGASQQVCSGEANRFQFVKGATAAQDKIIIKNLPFDLDGTYVRDATRDRQGFRAFSNASGARQYYALYAETSNGTGAGVVGTGDYLDYGYGGTTFKRGTTVNLPAVGEASYDGDYAGIRVYKAGGIGFVDGDAHMDVDFEDFQGAGAIELQVYNRTAYDSSGNVIGTLPDLTTKTTGANGAIIKQTTIQETLPGNTVGATGTMDGIFGGPDGKEVAGVIVIQGADSVQLSGGGTPSTIDDVKETGAFLLLQTTYTAP